MLHAVRQIDGWKATILGKGRFTFPWLAVYLMTGEVCAARILGNGCLLSNQAVIQSESIVAHVIWQMSCTARAVAFDTLL